MFCVYLALESGIERFKRVDWFVRDAVPMTPQSMHARADLAVDESISSRTQAPAAKPQVRLVKIDGKLTAVPVQEYEPVQAREPVHAVKPLQAVKPAPAVQATQPQPVQALQTSQANKSGTLRY